MKSLTTATLSNLLTEIAAIYCVFANTRRTQVRSNYNFNFLVVFPVKVVTRYFKIDTLGKISECEVN